MKKENLYISLVNHASVLVEKGDISILSDPWYFGSAFHEGWSLIHENKESEIFSSSKVIFPMGIPAENIPSFPEVKTSISFYCYDSMIH